MHTNNKKIARLSLFFTSIICASCIYAQSWTAAIGGQQNVCQGKTQCQCPQGYSYGKATAGNCTINGDSGCWNPSVNGTGSCFACGEGGTVALGQLACFDKGYSNSPGSQNNSPSGVACSTNSQCTGSGTYSGG